MLRFLPPLLLLSLFLDKAFAQEAAPKLPTPEQIRQAIKQLGDAHFAAREQSSKTLWQMGRAAESALREATKSTDEELATRARAIVEKFDWDIYPDTPKDVLKFIDEYRRGGGVDRVEVLVQLLKVRPSRMVTIRKLIAQEKDAAALNTICEYLGSYLRQILPDLIERDELDDVQELLEICLVNSTCREDFATFVMLRGKIEPSIKKYEKLFFGSQGENAKIYAETLMHLARLKKDWPAARRYAAAAENPQLSDWIAWLSNDWKAMAKIEEIDRHHRSVLPPTYFRLAGNRVEYQKLLDGFRKEVAKNEMSDERIKGIAEAMLLNHHGSEAIDLLLDYSKGTSGTNIAFELLAGQLKFREAYAYIDRVLLEVIFAEYKEPIEPYLSEEYLRLRRAYTSALLGGEISPLSAIRRRLLMSGTRECRRLAL